MKASKHFLAALMLGFSLVANLGSAAAHSSGYSDFLQTMNEITGATMPVVELPSLVWPSLAAGKAVQILSIAKTMLGFPVVWGGASPIAGFDCSGLVQYVYAQAGIDLPRTADLQFMVGRTVAKSELQPGDLVYFTTYEPGASHVGIYIGAEKFIHTSFSRRIVAIADISDDYFVQRYYGAKRVL
jgi:cell wall-associated NlpC family hydrolase